MSALVEFQAEIHRAMMEAGQGVTMPPANSTGEANATRTRRTPGAYNVSTGAASNSDADVDATVVFVGRPETAADSMIDPQNMRAVVTLPGGVGTVQVNDLLEITASGARYVVVSALPQQMAGGTLSWLCEVRG